VKFAAAMLAGLNLAAAAARKLYPVPERRAGPVRSATPDCFSVNSFVAPAALSSVIWASSDLIKRAFELFNGFDQRRALQRPLSRLAPQAHRLLDLPSFSAVTRQQFGLAFGDVGELTFDGFGDPRMESASRLAQ
jgi:hypothetical protein